MDILNTTLLVNLSTLIFAFIAGAFVWRLQHPGRFRFALGLCLVSLSGLLAIPATEIFAGSFITLITLSNIIGVFHGAGLVVCASAFVLSEKRV
jgi:hypothetical protein